MKKAMKIVGLVLALALGREAVVNAQVFPAGSGSSLPALIETKIGVILAPTGATDVIVWRAPFACTVTKIQAYTVGGTSADVNALNDGLDLLAADLTATAGSWASTTTIQNASIAVDDTLTIQIIGVSGTPTSVTIQVECTR